MYYSLGVEQYFLGHRPLNMRLQRHPFRERGVESDSIRDDGSNIGVRLVNLKFSSLYFCNIQKIVDEVEGTGRICVYESEILTAPSGTSRIGTRAFAPRSPVGA